MAILETRSHLAFQSIVIGHPAVSFWRLTPSAFPFWTMKVRGTLTRWDEILKSRRGKWSSIINWLVVSNIFFIFTPIWGYLGKWSNLTNFFQRVEGFKLISLFAIPCCALWTCKTIHCRKESWHHTLSFRQDWWVQISFIFIPTWGNDPIWRAYFSDGLVQPPPRWTCCSTCDTVMV